MPASILIVEDHEIVRRVLRNLLEVKFSEYPVIEAASGEDVIALALTEPPRLVIMDISLPGMSGIEATRKLRASFPSTPILIFTVHEDSIYRQEAEAAGACAYVTKHALQNDLLPQLTSILIDNNGH
jgi:two-component system invasion response regulator UvrY